MSSQLTSDDLDGIGYDAMRASEPRAYVHELVDAVEQGRLADPADTSYALGLAADISERCGDPAETLRLSARSVSAAEGTTDHGWTRGRHADLLLRAGEGDEGMRVLTELRPLLTRDPLAVSSVVDALVENGRAELAEQWLTAAFTTALELAERTQADTEAADDAWEIVEGLATRRLSVRQDLGLAPDEVDEFGDEVRSVDDASADLVFWPEAAFAEALAAAPDHDLLLSTSWDGHRTGLESELQAGDAEGDPPLVEVATPELLAAVVAGADGRAVTPGPLMDWPPGRNEPCWCGSRAKYKKCCLPRGRP